MTEKKKPAEPPDAPPQLTFTEDELKQLTDYFNMVAEKAVLSLRPKEIHAFAKLQAHFAEHLKVVDAHIFEVRKHWKGSK